MTEPHSGKTRQLLRADRRSNQDRRQLKFFDQQTIEEPKSKNPQNAQTQLKQSQLETQEQGPLAHQQAQSIILRINCISERLRSPQNSAASLSGLKRTLRVKHHPY